MLSDVDMISKVSTLVCAVEYVLVLGLSGSSSRSIRLRMRDSFVDMHLLEYEQTEYI